MTEAEELISLRAEVARLREALEEIAAEAVGGTEGAWASLEKIDQIADRALASLTDPEKEG